MLNDSTIYALVNWFIERRFQRDTDPMVNALAAVFDVDPTEDADSMEIGIRYALTKQEDVRLVNRLTTALYEAPAGTIPAVPSGETAERVEINIDGIRFVWRRNLDGTYRRWAGPIGWLVEEFERELS